MGFQIDTEFGPRVIPLDHQIGRIYRDGDGMGDLLSSQSSSRTRFRGWSQAKALIKDPANSEQIAEARKATAVKNARVTNHLLGQEKAVVPWPEQRAPFKAIPGSENGFRKAHSRGVYVQ